jgi:hypothetical protein
MKHHLLSLTMLLSLAAAGCQSGSRDGVSPSASSPTTSTTGATPTRSTPSAVAPLAQVTPQTISATLSPQLPDQLFVTELDANGVTLLRSDASTTAPPAANSSVTLPGSQGQAQFGLTEIASRDLGLVMTATAPLGQDPQLHIFRPSAANIADDLQTLSIANPRFLTVVTPAGSTNSLGAPVTAFVANTPTSAAFVETSQGLHLFISFANRKFPAVRSRGAVEPGFSNPGCVIVFDVANATTTPSLRRRQVILSSSFEPAQLELVGQGNQARLLLAANGVSTPNGPAARSSANIDVIDPEALTVTATIDLGTTDRLGPFNVNDDGSLAHIAGSVVGQGARVFEIDLTSDQLSRQFDLLYSQVDTTTTVSIASSENNDLLYVLLPGDRVIATLQRIPGLVLERLDLTRLAALNRRALGRDLPVTLSRRLGDPESTLFVATRSTGASNSANIGSNTVLEVVTPRFR